MIYLKSLVINFLIIFFANHILPGINVINQTKLPHIGGDLIFAVALGFLNMLIFPVLRLILREVNWIKSAILAIILNFVVYAIVKIVPPIGIKITSVQGYVVASLVVAVGSFITNFYEMKRSKPKKPEMPE